MAWPNNPPSSIESLVEHMFEDVLTSEERAELLLRIRDWEDANPGVDNAHRITGWIDVAYDFQASSMAGPEVRGPERTCGIVSRTLFLVPTAN